MAEPNDFVGWDYTSSSSSSSATQTSSSSAVPDGLAHHTVTRGTLRAMVQADLAENKKQAKERAVKAEAEERAPQCTDAKGDDGWYRNRPRKCVGGACVPALLTQRGRQKLFCVWGAKVWKRQEVCVYVICLGNGGPYDMEGFQKCLHPLKVLAKAYV